MEGLEEWMDGGMEGDGGRDGGGRRGMEADAWGMEADGWGMEGERGSDSF